MGYYRDHKEDRAALYFTLNINSLFLLTKAGDRNNSCLTHPHVFFSAALISSTINLCCPHLPLELNHRPIKRCMSAPRLVTHRTGFWFNWCVCDAESIPWLTQPIGSAACNEWSMDNWVRRVCLVLNSVFNFPPLASLRWWWGCLAVCTAVI